MADRSKLNLLKRKHENYKEEYLHQRSRALYRKVCLPKPRKTAKSRELNTISKREVIPKPGEDMALLSGGELFRRLHEEHQMEYVDLEKNKDEGLKRKEQRTSKLFYD